MKIYKIIDKQKYLLLLKDEKGYQIFFLLSDLYREESSFYRKNYFSINSTNKFKKKYFIDTSKRYRIKTNSIRLKFYTNLSDDDQKKFLFFLQNKDNQIN